MQMIVVSLYHIKPAEVPSEEVLMGLAEGCVLVFFIAELPRGELLLKVVDGVLSQLLLVNELVYGESMDSLFEVSGLL